MSEDLADRIEALDVVEVTQADREAAADVWRDYIARIGEVMAEKAIRKGISDDTIIVQAFARHRITALRLAETSAALPDDVAGLVEWLEAQIVTDSHHTEKCYLEADKFAAITDYDWTPVVNSWRYHGDQAAERLARWKALLDIIRDRDEWRTQHENLLSVRQSDLEALTAQAQRIAELETILVQENPPLTNVALKKRIAELEARLEVEPEWGEQADGISCRDDTIKLQDERIGALEAENARLREALATMANSINIVGSHYDHAVQALDALVRSIKTQARAALGGSTDV